MLLPNVKGLIAVVAVIGIICMATTQGISASQPPTEITVEELTEMLGLRVKKVALDPAGGTHVQVWLEVYENESPVSSFVHDNPVNPNEVIQVLSCKFDEPMDDGRSLCVLIAVDNPLFNRRFTHDGQSEFTAYAGIGLGSNMVGERISIDLAKYLDLEEFYGADWSMPPAKTLEADVPAIIYIMSTRTEEQREEYPFDRRDIDMLAQMSELVVVVRAIQSNRSYNPYIRTFK